MEREELKVVMANWAAKCGSELVETGVASHQGDEADFSFRWNKELPILGEEGWEILEDGSEIRVYASADNEEIFFEYDQEDAVGYEMVISVELVSEVNDALELLWNANEEILSDPIPEALQNTRLAELRTWFEDSYTECDEDGCACGGECDCEEGECECECGQSEDPRLVILTCDATPAPKLHCPACGQAVGPTYCKHVLFVNRNHEELIYVLPRFEEELKEREIDQAEFAGNLLELRKEDFWDSDYLFLDVFAFDGEESTDLIVGFHMFWE